MTTWWVVCVYWRVFVWVGEHAHAREPLIKFYAVYSTCFRMGDPFMRHTAEFKMYSLISGIAQCSWKKSIRDLAVACRGREKGRGIVSVHTDKTCIAAGRVGDVYT
jgi:hypothetical protein